VLPSAAAGGGRAAPLIIAAAVLAVGGGAAAWYAFFRTPAQRADVLLHTVKREPLVITVAEKGTLESADNADIVCRVKAGNKGFSSTINWVIDDGSRVKPGQLLMILDDSGLKDQEDEQRIKLQTAEANLTKAQNDYKIAVDKDANVVRTALAALELAEIELEKFTGLSTDPTRLALAALGGGPLHLSEDGSHRQKLDDLTGQLRLAESEVEQFRERSAWADRMVKLSYMSAAQAQAEKSKMDSAVEKMRSLQTQRRQWQTYDRRQQIVDLTSKRDNARAAVELAKREAAANEDKARAEVVRAKSEFDQQDDRLDELVRQRSFCKIYAPDSIEPNSLVVYFKPESSRFGSSTQGLIEQGAQVKEGQKLLRIPNLSKMQVNTKVHEAMVARIRGDVRVPTHFVDGVQKLALFNTHAFGRLVSQQPEITERVRERYRNLEYKKLSDGQRATIRVDALPNRTFAGHVRMKATVASQADSWISDVKLYQTFVMVDSEVLPDGTHKPIQGEELTPDMTAEVRITVDASKDPVLTVPVQAVLGGTELAAKREVFVRTPTGYDRRLVTLGIYNEKVVEITDGLNEGDEVVLNPKVLLAADDRTRTRDEGGKAGPGSNGSGKGDYSKGDYSKGGSGEGQPGGPGGSGKGKKGGFSKGGGKPPGGPPAP
jgi:multidrug efflux pump subunit AcrA (membrane-fusion protein)